MTEPADKPQGAGDMQPGAGDQGGKDAPGGQAQKGAADPEPDAAVDRDGQKPKKKKLTPEEKMAKRFPQPVKVSFLVGLPMLDEANAVLGRIRVVIRSPRGKIKLVIGYGGLFGIGQRLIAVPIEVCGMLGRQVASLDMPRAAFDPAPTWYGSGDETVDRNETIWVAIARR